MIVPLIILHVTKQKREIKKSAFLYSFEKAHLKETWIFIPIIKETILKVWNNKSFIFVWHNKYGMSRFEATWLEYNCVLMALCSDIEIASKNRHQKLFNILPQA